nr:V-type ATP synthase subunit B [Endozoicomonas sp.]
SRLKQMVMGKETREDHPHLMNTMIRFYSDSVNAAQKQAMAFELSSYDLKTIKFGNLFKPRFMSLDAAMSLEDALDLCWTTMAECFSPEETLMKQSLLEKYWPNQEQVATGAALEAAEA